MAVNAEPISTTAPDFADRLIERASATYPEKAAAVGRPALLRLIDRAVEEARRWDSATDAGVCLFFGIMFSVGHGFIVDPKYPWVANTLRQSSGLSQSVVDIETRDGIVTLSGVVANPALKAEAVARTKSLPGVVSVVDRITVTDTGIRRAQFQPGGQPTQVAMGGSLFHQNQGAEAPIMMEGGYEGMPMDASASMGANNEGPAPEGPAGMVGATQASMPGQPNYAWPSYAPATNFSAVGYPTVYPWQAWPNIGPFYPYPEAKTAEMAAVTVSPNSQGTGDGEKLLKRIEQRARAMWGMSRTIVQNMVKGVAEGFTTKLEISGVGYRAALDGKILNLQLGYSHDIKFAVPDDIKVVCDTPTAITISGADKQRVGQIAAEIRAFRGPEPYKGKGVRYADEKILRKEGKKK